MKNCQSYHMIFSQLYLNEFVACIEKWDQKLSRRTHVGDIKQITHKSTEMSTHRFKGSEGST